jgi:general secretion pathway protein I
LNGSTRARRRRINAGFTLLEVLIALLVVAVSLAAIGSLMAATVRGERSIDQHLALVATARAAVTALPGHDLDVGTLAGSLVGHDWQVDVSPITGFAASPSKPTKWVPRRVIVRVQAIGGPVLEIATVRLQRTRQ